MISRNLIEKTAIKAQTSLENIAREYLQHLFLRAFYQEKEAEAILFKGGTALRLIYRSPRFSEDLDFSGFQVSVSKTEDLIEAALVEVNREEKIDLEEAKKTTGGYLARFQALVDGIKVGGKLEISFRAKKPLAGQILTIISPLLPPYTLCAYPEEKLAQEKLTALLTRAKTRDFYDLYFILRARLKIKLSAAEAKQIINKLERRNDDLFSQELKRFLPKSHHRLLKNFPQSLKRELERFDASG